MFQPCVLSTRYIHVRAVGIILTHIFYMLKIIISLALLATHLKVQQEKASLITSVTINAFGNSKIFYNQNATPEEES